MRGLRIADNLLLPADAVTQTFAILAKRGVGKTYTALVLVEELLKSHLQVVVADPVGVCWGLRASANGRGPGLPIVVLGGDHGDIPLEVGAGETIANLVVEERLSVVLDLSRFRKGEQVRFMTDFCERLYHKNRTPLHMVLDEADAFAPQRPMKGQERLLGAVEDLVRRGRARGLGITLVTQRSAVLNKDVLTQVEVLVALRTIAPQDRSAIDEWIKVHGTPDQREELMKSLPSLPIGEAWFWSPGWLDIFKRVRVRQRETFDSSATPKVGQKLQPPKKLAEVDLTYLRERIAATIEKAKADDPRELRKQITELQKQLNEKNEKIVVKSEIQRIEVPILKDVDLKRLESILTRLSGMSRSLQEIGHEIALALGKVNGHQQPLVKPTDSILSKPPRLVAQHHRIRAVANGQKEKTESRLSSAQQRILDKLAWLESIGISPATKTQLAIMSGYSPTSGGYFNNLGALRSSGFIDYPRPGMVSLTHVGKAEANAPDVPPTDEVLHQQIASILPASQSAILSELLKEYPNPITKEDLALRLGVSPTSGGYFNNLGRLRSLGLIDYPTPGRVVALPVLFLH